MQLSDLLVSLHGHVHTLSASNRCRGVSCDSLCGKGERVQTPQTYVPLPPSYGLVFITTARRFYVISWTWCFAVSVE